jgi:homoserine kinase
MASAGPGGAGAVAARVTGSRLLALEDPDALGAFLSGAGPSVAVLARREFARLEQLLASMYARAGCEVTIRTLAVHHAVAMAGTVSAHGGTV